MLNGWLLKLKQFLEIFFNPDKTSNCAAYFGNSDNSFLAIALLFKINLDSKNNKLSNI